MPLTEQMIRRYKEALASADHKRRQILNSGALDQQIFADNQPNDLRRNLMHVHAEEVQNRLQLKADPDGEVSFRDFYQYAEEGKSFAEIMRLPAIQTSFGENDPEAMKLYYMACKEDIALKEENLRILNTFYQNLRYSDSPNERQELTVQEKKAVQYHRQQTISALEKGDSGRGFHILLVRPGITEEEKQHISALLSRNDLQSKQELFDLYVRELSRIPEEYLDREQVLEASDDPVYLYYMHLGADYGIFSPETKALHSEEEQKHIKILTDQLMGASFLIGNAMSVYLSGKPYPEGFETMPPEQLLADANISRELMQYAGQKTLPEASRQETVAALHFLKNNYRTENIPEMQPDAAEAEQQPVILPEEITRTADAGIRTIYQQTFEDNAMFHAQPPVPAAEVPVLPDGETDYQEADSNATAAEQFLHRYGPQVRNTLAAGGIEEERIRLFYHATQQYAGKMEQLRSRQAPLSRNELNELLALNKEAQIEAERIFNRIDDMEPYQKSLSSALSADRAVMLQIAGYPEDARHSFQADLLTAKVRVHGRLPAGVQPAVNNRTLIREANRRSSIQETVNEAMEIRSFKTEEKNARYEILTIAAKIDNMSFNSYWTNSRQYGNMLDAFKKLSSSRIPSPQELLKALKTAKETAAAYRDAKDTNFYGRHLEEDRKAERSTEEGRKRYQLAQEIERTCGRYEQELNRSWQKLSEAKKKKLTADLHLPDAAAENFRVRDVRQRCKELETRIRHNANTPHPESYQKFDAREFAEYHILHQLILGKQTNTIHRMNQQDLKDRIEAMANSDAMKYMQDYFRNAERTAKPEILEACYESSLQHAKDFEAAGEVNYESLEVMIHNLQTGKGKLARKSGFAAFDRVMKENKIQDLQGLAEEKKQQRIKEMQEAAVQAETAGTGTDAFQKQWLQKILDQEDPEVNAKIRKLRSQDFTLDTSRQYLAVIAVCQLTNTGMSIEDIMNDQVGETQKIQAFCTALDCFHPKAVNGEASFEPDLERISSIVGPAMLTLSEKNADCAKKIDFEKDRLNSAEFRKFSFLTDIIFDISQSDKAAIPQIGTAIRHSIQEKYHADLPQSEQIYQNLCKCNDIAELLRGPKSEAAQLSAMTLYPQAHGQIRSLLHSSILAKETARQNGGKILASFGSLKEVRPGRLNTAIARQTAALDPIDPMRIHQLRQTLNEVPDVSELCTQIESNPEAAELLVPSILDGSYADTFHFRNGELTAMPDYDESIRQAKQQHLTMTKKFAEIAAEKRKDYQNLPDSYGSSLRKESLNALKEIQHDFIPPRGYTSPAGLQRSSQLMTAIFKADFMKQCSSMEIPKVQAEAALRNALNSPETRELYSPGSGSLRSFLLNRESEKMVRRVMKTPAVRHTLHTAPQAEVPQIRN